MRLVELRGRIVELRGRIVEPRGRMVKPRGRIVEPRGGINELILRFAAERGRLLEQRFAGRKKKKQREGHGGGT